MEIKRRGGGESIIGEGERREIWLANHTAGLEKEMKRRREEEEGGREREKEDKKKEEKGRGTSKLRFLNSDLCRLKALNHGK